MDDKKDGIIFTTEYRVEDYVEISAIISKNDGLLYGVVDNNGTWKLGDLNGNTLYDCRYYDIFQIEGGGIYFFSLTNTPWGYIISIWS